MSQITSHRPAEEWLTDLQKAKVEGLTGIKPKISIQDLLERVNAGTSDADPSAPESQLIPTSPRSVEACFILGVDPIELQYHPLTHYRRNGEDDDIAQLRYEKCEAFRQEQIKSLIEERKRLIDEGWSGEPGKPAAGAGKEGTGRKRSTETNAMVEKERQRLEVLKRRQEREMQQMVQHEVFRKEMLDKQTKKVQELERRAQELARQKAENDAAWISKQRELELQKLHEEKELEKEAKRMAEERYQREREMQRREQEEERRRKKEAYMKEMERRQKAEEARRETEAILAAQADEVMQRKMRMEELDSQRAKRLEQETKERALLNMDKRKKAEIRIQSAMETNAELLRRKREDFRRREQIAEERRQQLDELRRKEEERKREEERRKEKERHDKYLQALEQEEARKSFMRLRADEKDRMLAELYAMRKKENDIRRVEKEFELKLRLDKVDAIQKTNLYHRQQLLEKIMSEYDRTRSLMSQREKLQNERKMANMTASLQRHMMNQAMDQLKVKNKMGALSGPGGSLNLNDLVARRPATAM